MHKLFFSVIAVIIFLSPYSVGAAGVLNESCNPSLETSCQARLTCNPVSKTCQLSQQNLENSESVDQNNNQIPQNFPPGTYQYQRIDNSIYLPPEYECKSGLVCASTLTEFITGVIEILLMFAGSLAVLFVIIGGFMYITSAGNEEKAERAKKTLVNAIIGIIIISLSYVIVNAIINLVSSPNGNGF